MQGRITSVLLIFAIMFGTVITPIIAHAQAASAWHSAEFLEIHDHEGASERDTQEKDGDKPCHAVAHHHCSIALRVETPATPMALALSKTSFLASLHTAMASLSQAPPTEPPAA
jgi:hypothetical protein